MFVFRITGPHPHSSQGTGQVFFHVPGPPFVVPGTARSSFSEPRHRWRAPMRLGTRCRLRLSKVSFERLAAAKPAQAGSRKWSVLC
jgi:hypothetical protein